MSWVKHLWKSTDYITPQVMNNFEDGMEQAVNDASNMENFGVTFEDAGEEFTPNIQIKDADRLGGRLPSYFAKESELNLSGITNPNWQKNNVGEVANAIHSDLTKLTESEYITVTCHSYIRNYLACHRVGNKAHIYGLIAVDAEIPINTDFLYTRTAKINSSFALVNIVGGANNMASIIGNHATNNQAPIAIGTYMIDTWYEI